MVALFDELVEALIKNGEESEFIVNQWIGENGDGLAWMF